MKAFIEKENRTIEIAYKGKLDELFEAIGINKETVIVMRDGELIIDEDMISDSDELRIISVVSGG